MGLFELKKGEFGTGASVPKLGSIVKPAKVSPKAQGTYRKRPDGVAAGASGPLQFVEMAVLVDVKTPLELSAL